jgi:hypothetical protein
VKGISKLALIKKSSTLQTGGISKLISWENLVSFLKEICELKAFSNGRLIHFMKSTHFRWNRETHVSYGTIPCVKAGVCCSLFPYGNWVTCLKEYCLTLSVFMCEEHHLCAK